MIGDETQFYTSLGYTAEALTFATFLLKDLTVPRYRNLVNRANKNVETSWLQISTLREGIIIVIIFTVVLITIIFSHAAKKI
jgi:ABC-type microcin C transport system permease subunit YejE